VTGVPFVFCVGGVQVKVADPVVGCVTLTVALCAADPPVPVQVIVYLVVVVSAAVVCEPLVASAPLQPPEAAQLIALVEDQASTDVAPLAIVLGLALKLTVGTGVVTVTVAVCAAVPPVPVQVRV
jgi:hypothetical protein